MILMIGAIILRFHIPCPSHTSKLSLKIGLWSLWKLKKKTKKTLDCILKYFFEPITLEWHEMWKFLTRIFLEIRWIARWCLAVIWE
jgi:hypothetical protein